MCDAAVPFVIETDPATRSTVYRLLSMVYRYPTQELFEAFQNGEFLAELEDNLVRIPHLMELAHETVELEDKTENDLEGITFQDFQVDFTRTFDVGAPEPPCPPYEGTYRKGVEKTATLLAVSEFYKHFGLTMDPGEGKRELADHVSAELEFLHFLTFKEAQARKEQTAELLRGYIMAQRDFLQRHPADWLPLFYEKLKGAGVLPFYVQLTKITADILRYDLQWLNAELGNA